MGALAGTLARGRNTTEPVGADCLTGFFMPTTTRERLESVRDAIDAVLTGAQEYWLGDRRVSRADLGDLQVLETRLMNRVMREEQRRPFASAADMSDTY